ncbi:MAG: transcription antitermination factor NusB [Desulfobacteraceae bacterium]|jgi:N utilization substance protein B|nr:transcription antitermination factor NusB [Desulfobacteraceae bacterium]
MGTRRQARELAMQALFYMDIRKDASEETLEYFCGCFCPSKKSRPFFRKLVNGVLGTKEQIDALVERHSQNWNISRMSCVDRNVMRIAVYEMLYCDDIPPKVSINEAVDIGKKFGTQESGAFINGIMDSIREALLEEGTLQKMNVARYDAVE